MDDATTTIAVTGATGRLGGRVARRLAVAGIPQRLLVRDPTRAPDLPAAEVMVAPYRDGGGVRRALEGIETVFMVSASESPDRVREHATFIDAAVAAGVSRLVYVSFLGAGTESTFTLARDHWATEQHIRGSGLRYTILRSNLFADFFPRMVGEDGVIRGPAGEGRVSAVAQDDVADVAVTVLRQPGRHDKVSYDLTGPEAVTLHEVAEVLSTYFGREIRYHPETVMEAYESRAHYGAPDWQVDAWVSTYSAIERGELAKVSDAVERLTGHPPLSLAQVFATPPATDQVSINQ